jgi:YD repeat-containing protein
VALEKPTVMGYDAIRDDGQVITFWLDGSSFVSPPGLAMHFEQVAAGFHLTDAQDHVEAYDGTGKLLSITGRSGVIQTMGYDPLGRLSTVTNSFGGQITLGYDPQGRISSVSRQ